MCEELRLERYDKSPWGFRLTGGLDFGAPLTVVKVTGGSIAELGGVQVGDIVVEISGQSTKNMTHTDAQNVIGQAQRSLNIIVMRGSLVTPPDVTPLRGMTPMTELDGLRHSQSSLNSELLNERLENLKTAPGREDGMKCPPIVHENGGLTATEVTGRVMHPTPLPGHESNMTVDTNMSEMELDELLTGNEEVLDQGVLGINFKKFMPQVDFIRQSEVFKFLQNQNTHKELPEDVQLEKEPTKRFSTFLQKPRAPPRKPGGPLWIHPKPPRYLPKDERKEAELPKLRPKQPKVDPGHSVLWLFLDETGEDVEDERWGTAEEERLNLSRNEFIEYDRSSVASMKSRSESSYSNIDNAQLREESCSRASENEESSAEDKKATKFVAKCTIEEVAEIEDEPTQEASRCRERTPEPSREKDQEQQKENIKNSGNGRIVSVETKETTNVTEKLMKQIQTQQTVESCKLKSRRDEEEEKFSKQLADIKAQIASLEDQAPSDLQTQLLTIHDQLEKIVKLKLMQSAQYKEEKEHYKEAVDEVEEEEEVDEELEDEEVEEEIKIEETITEKQIIEERTEEKLTETTETRVVLVDENGEEVDGEYEDQEEEDGEDSVDGVKKFKKGEYELCEAAPPKKSRGPITPLARPIVLPGGRQWRQPKDAACEEFYTGVLVAQADVLIGSDDGSNDAGGDQGEIRPFNLSMKCLVIDFFRKGFIIIKAPCFINNFRAYLHTPLNLCAVLIHRGVNFTKYVPPKFDMSHSAVYRLIHEIEDKTRKKEPLEEHYQTPIGKRHFYAAKLKPPPPIGEVELKDL